LFVHHAQGFLHHDSKTDFYRLLFITHEYIVVLWILSVILLGMGGIVREHATGTSSLTLSLPVSRAWLLGVRMAVGVLEAIALGVVPWLTIFVVSNAGGMPVLFPQVIIYMFLLIAGGLAYFAMAILVSSLVEGEYTAPAVAFGLVFLATILFDAWLRRLTVNACLDLARRRQRRPIEVERQLMAILPRERWTRTTDLLIFHGRRICIARKPRCGICPVQDLCPSAAYFLNGKVPPWERAKPVPKRGGRKTARRAKAKTARRAKAAKPAKPVKRRKAKKPAPKRAGRR